MPGKPDNMAAWLHGIDDLRVEPFNDMTEGELAPDEVRIKIGAVGICGSDVHYLKAGRIADFIVKDPMVIGHESAGTISEVGSSVNDLKPGDRVAIEPGVPCRECALCKEGRYNLCAEMKFFATPPFHGSLAGYVKHPAVFCFKLPEGMSMEQGAMCEPVSVGVHACRRAGVKAGDKIAILGAGPIGLVSAMVARALDASAVVITDMSEERLELAKQLGATHGINIKGMQPAEVAAKIKEVLGEQPKASIDACGFEASVTTALLATATGGRVAVVGMGQDEMKLPITAAAAREVDICGVFRYRDCYPTSIDLISNKKINVDPLITNRFDLTKSFTQEVIKEAFETSARGRDVIKVMFNLEEAGK